MTTTKYDLAAERAALVAEARKILDTADAEKRELRASEQRRYDAINADIDRIDDDARADADHEERLDRMNRRSNPFTRPVDHGQGRAARGGRDITIDDARAFL